MAQVPAPDVATEQDIDVDEEIADKVRELFGDDYGVVIMDSDFTTFDEVERACVALFGYTLAEAKVLSMKVHTAGEALAAVLGETAARRAVRQLRSRNVLARVEKI